MDYEEYSPIPDRCETCEQLRAEVERLRMPDEIAETIRQALQLHESLGNVLVRADCMFAFAWLDARKDG